MKRPGGLPGEGDIARRWEHLPVPLVQHPVRQEHCATGRRGWAGHGVGGRRLCRFRETGVSQLRKAALGPPHPNTEIPESRGSVPPLPYQAQAEGIVGLAEISPSRGSCPLTPSLTSSRTRLLDKPPSGNSMETCPVKLTVWPGGNRPWNGNQQTLTGRGRGSLSDQGPVDSGPSRVNVESL